jgi:hypothetical protein
MLISDASIRRHWGEHDASLTHLACFRRHRVAAHVSISGSVATYLIGPERRVLVRRWSSVLPSDRPMTHPSLVAS